MRSLSNSVEFETMKCYVVILSCLIITLISRTEAKQFTRCGLAKELLKLKFDKTFVPNWVCLIESESAKDTAKVTKKANGSTNYGLFQINDREWCKQGKVGGKCNMKCEDFLDDNIEDDSACAKKVQEERGFQAWDGWVRSCYQKNINYVTNCF